MYKIPIYYSGVENILKGLNFSTLMVHMESIMSLAFTILCSVCFEQIQPYNGKACVLSCGDFLCQGCSLKNTNNACQACGKVGVRSAALDNTLPEEVRLNISDPTEGIQSLHSILLFQVKFYKQTIKRLLTKIQALEAELNKPKE